MVKKCVAISKQDLTSMLKRENCPGQAEWKDKINRFCEW